MLLSTRTATLPPRRLPAMAPREAGATRSLLASAALALLANTAQAQALPSSAGQLLEETRRTAPPPLPPRTAPRVLEAPVRPTLAMPDGVAVTVSGFRVTGAVSFNADTLSSLVQPWVGKRLDIRGLNEAAGALTRHYQANGHLLSYAYLPAQRVADGVIELAVLEGKLEGVQVVTAQEVRLRDAVVQAHTDSLTAPGPVLQGAVERKLLLLNDIPGVAARAAFTPGGTTGGADLVVTVAEDDPLEMRAEISNHGAQSTGRLRAGLSLEFRDLFGWGDHTTARGFLSDKGGLVTGSLRSSVPVGGDGWKFGGSMSRLKYQLAGTFRLAGATGTADTFGVEASYALRRSADANLWARVGLDHKRLHDEVQLAGESVNKRNDTGELGINFDFRDPLDGVSAGNASLTIGQLRQVGQVRREWRKLNAQFARQQAIAGPFSLYARVAGQTTGSNLDSSEKLGLGGASAVRAYASGEASVDHGVLASLELRYSLDFLGGNVVGSLFHDYGGGQINRQALGSPGNDPELNGTGFGISWAGSGIGLNASLAWRGSRLPTTDGNDPRPRLYLQLFYTP